MNEVVGVRFKKVGKVYYFSPKGMTLNVGDKVIVETSKGVECGEVVIANKQCDNIIAPLKEIIRKVNAQDLQVIENNKKKEKDAFKIWSYILEFFV